MSPWLWSLTADRSGFAFEAEQMAPNGTCFPGERSPGHRPTLSPPPADHPSEAVCHLWVLGGGGLTRLTLTPESQSAVTGPPHPGMWRVLRWPWGRLSHLLPA